MDSINFDKLSSQPGLFVPAAKPGNPFFEIWRDGSKYESREGYLADSDVEEWVNQRGKFEISSPEGNVCRDVIRLIFGRPRSVMQRTPSGRIHDHGHVYPFLIPFKRATFTMLLDRCKLSRQILDLKEHRAIAGHSSGYAVQDESSGVSNMRSFLGLIRLHNHTALITAYSYNISTGNSTGLVLQADEAEMKAIKERILYHKACTGHELLLRTIMAEMSLSACAEQVSEVKQDVMDIEDSTGQHTWNNYRASSQKPKTDVELSRIAHGLRIQVAVLCRRIETGLYWIELLGENLKQEQNDSASGELLLEWIRNMKTKTQMTKLDVDLIAKRAEIQVGAIYSRFAQRDNITTQKISEATNRDSSAMKYLAVLGALFLPGTFVATLFSMDALKGQPFWVYWVITTPLTFIVLGVWTYWTHWRSKSVKEKEQKLDEKSIA